MNQYKEIDALVGTYKMDRNIPQTAQSGKTQRWQEKCSS